MRRGIQSEKLFLFSYFLTCIGLGTAILYIPASWTGAERLRLVDAPFTATSAVCVTGLITVDTPTFSTLGRIVILILIQAGGLGIITFSTIYLAQPRGRISLIRHRVIRGYYLESSGLGPTAIVRGIVAVTPRTAGFNTIPQGELSAPAKTFTMLLMFIGGGSGSIAGGIKVNTFFIVLLMLFQGHDSRAEVTVFKRKIVGARIFHATMFMGRIGLLALAIPRSRPYPVHVLDHPQGEVLIG